MIILNAFVVVFCAYATLRAIEDQRAGFAAIFVALALFNFAAAVLRSVGAV